MANNSMAVKKNTNITICSSFGNDFDKIRKYFDKLNNDKSHFVNSNDICTPMDCVKEMVDKVPASFWRKSNTKILDCCCGNGNFHAYICTKTKFSNLYFNEINETRIANLKKYFGKNINLTKKDFLSFPDREEYDMIVANPPYAKFSTDGSRVSKNHNLSRSFIEKAIKLVKPNGYILFIVPNNWMSYADRNTLPMLLTEYQFIHLDIHGAKKYFPKVGSSFTWFLLQKKKNSKPMTISNNYVIKDTQTATVDIGAKYIPLYYSEIVRNIFSKTVNNDQARKYNVETSSYLHKYTKKILLSTNKDDNHPYKLWHTPTQTVYSEIPHKYQKGYKVFISLTNQFSCFVDNCGMTQSIAFIRCKTKAEAQKVKKELESPVYKFINNVTRYGNFNNERILQRLPVLDEINLTDEEISFINDFNEKYYSKGEKMAKSRNIRIIKNFDELNNEIDFDTYEYKQYFSLLCRLVPNKNNECLEIDKVDTDNFSRKGLIYIFVIDGKIFKIGQTTNNINNRISSYNCGKTEYRINGTNSTTNYFILQSLLNINKTVDVYAYFPPLAEYKIFDKPIKSSEAPSKYGERIINENFIKTYSKKPIGNTQK